MRDLHYLHWPTRFKQSLSKGFMTLNELQNTDKGNFDQNKKIFPFFLY